MRTRTNVAKTIESAVEAIADLLVERVTRRMKRHPNRAAHHLDMRCRVARCENRSRGPRFGYICDAHRAKLSKREQQAAREAYQSRKET